MCRVSSETPTESIIYLVHSDQNTWSRHTLIPTADTVMAILVLIIPKLHGLYGKAALATKIQ